MFAAISPRNDAAGLLCDNSEAVQVLGPTGAPVQRISAERYLSRYPDTMVVDVRDGDHACNVLAERATMSMCLDMVLLLFDGDVSVPTRQELALEVNRLFQDADNRNYVLDIILCYPLPPTADVDGAMEAVTHTSIAREVVESIIQCQDRVRLILNSWLLVKQEAIVQQAGAERVFALFSRYGFFRRLALEASNTSCLDQIKTPLMMEPNLRTQLDAAPRIVFSLLNTLRTKLPVGKVTAPKRADEAHDDVDGVDWNEGDVEHPQHRSGHAAFRAAVSQVDRIAQLYSQGKDMQAGSFLTELIAEQLRHPGNERNLVKSLCNLAVQVDAHGRSDICLECLMKALEYPKGIDGQLYLQIGTALRELRCFDQAATCYDRAKQLDSGSLDEKIRLAAIQLWVARGNYEQALADYFELPDLRFRPTELVGLGTLYRKMGRLREAREEFRRSLSIDRNNHRAFAGLAELSRQAGKPHRAIAQYNMIIERFHDLDVRSMKAYDLARSRLYRFTEQYHRSEHILRNLANEFSADREVQLHYANLLALKGEFVRAKEHFEKASGPSLQGLGQLIFAKACKVFDSTYVLNGLSELRPTLMPEDHALAQCVEVYDLITRQRYDRVHETLRDAKFIDRMLSDFAGVLGFHALSKVSPGFNYKSDYRLCRIAKRSDRGLRRAIYSIATGNYVEAERLEARFLLRIAA